MKAPATIPILRSADLERTSAFYQRLGFEEKARWPGDYLIVSHELGPEIHFWHAHGLVPSTNDSGCYIRFPSAAGARALHESWSAAGLDSDQLRPIEATDYGLEEFALLDPDRNVLRVGGVVEG